MPLLKKISLTSDQEAYVRKNHWAMSRDAICKHLGITIGVLASNIFVMDLPKKQLVKPRNRDVSKKGFFNTDDYLKGLQTI